MNIRNILICDDHELFRSGIKNFAMSYFGENKNFIEASSGIQAIELFTQYNPEIVFLDIEIPRINGIAVCEKIKSVNSNTIVIIISMHSEKLIYSAVKKAKANAYFTKGESNKKMAEGLNYVLKMNSFYSSIKDNFQLENEYKEYEMLINRLNTLTNSEKNVLKLVVESKNSNEISEIMFIAIKSVNNYRNRICRKLHLPISKNSLTRWTSENQSSLKLFFA